MTRIARSFGLSWSRSRIVAIEAGTRQLAADEMILLPAIVQTLTDEPVTLADLLEGEIVELAPGAIGTNLDRLFTAADVVDLVDVDQTEWGRAVDAKMRDARRGLDAMRDGLRDLKRAQTLAGRRVTSRDLRAAERRIGEADRKAARAVGEPLPVVLAVSLALWGRTLGEERDERLGDTSGQPARTVQARRGRVTRNLYTELRDEITKKESKQ